MGNGRYLVISDLQIPFENPRALEFCRQIRKEFSIPHENIYCVGDELDQWWGSLFKKDAEFEHTPNQELEDSRKRLVDWFIAFPKMKIAESNHGLRWKKKAFDAQIPIQLIRSMQDVFKTPPGWIWQNSWHVEDKHPFVITHGHQWGGQYPHKNAATHLAKSVVIGHHHSIAGIEWIKTEGFSAWGMATGCLINFETYAFHYARDHKLKPLLGIGVVLDNGKRPIWIQM